MHQIEMSWCRGMQRQTEGSQVQDGRRKVLNLVEKLADWSACRPSQDRNKPEKGKPGQRLNFQDSYEIRLKHCNMNINK